MACIRAVAYLRARIMSGRTVKLLKIIRGTEVVVYATSFDGDPSVGIPYGPEEVWAKDINGNDFGLTDEEVEEFSIEAAEACEDDYIDYE
jgi:hypothetical protein